MTTDPSTTGGGRRSYTIVGAGAVGLLYGTRLAVAGHPVRWLVRSGADTIAAEGIEVRSEGRRLRIEPAEARGLMDEYFETFGGVRDYLAGVVDEARRSGFTETIMGRRRYLPDLTSDNRQRREMAERMALNAPIQGSAADLVKVAMIGVQSAVEEAGLASRMLLQVHDELVLEVADGEEAVLEELVRAQMGAAADLTVDLEVSVGTGRSWHDAAH